MPSVPVSITDLSTTAASNAPAGTDSPSVLDDIQRAHGAFIAQLRTGAVAHTNLSTTGNTTLGDASTDTVQANGYMGVGGAAVASVGMYVKSSALTGTSQFGAAIEPVITSSATTRASAVSTQVSLAASAFTTPIVIGYDAANAGVLSGGAAITDLHGVRVQDQTRGANNFGVTSMVSAGAGKWNFYAIGTAANYFAGDLVFATGKGVDFSAVTGGTGVSTSNVLDDYEEGTFTPTIVGTTTAGTGTYSEQSGRYTKIGNRVDFSIALTWSAHSGSGSMRISGLPFTSSSAVASYHSAAIWHTNIAMTAGNTLQSFINTGGTQILLYQVPTGGGAAGTLPIDTAGGLIVTGHYEV